MNENFVHRSSSYYRVGSSERLDTICEPLRSGQAPCGASMLSSPGRWKASVNVRYAYKDCLRTPSSNPDAVPEVHTSFPVDGCRPCWPTMLSKVEMLQRLNQRRTRSFRSSPALIAVCSLSNEHPMPPFLKSRQESKALAANQPSGGDPLSELNRKMQHSPAAHTEGVTGHRTRPEHDACAGNAPSGISLVCAVHDRLSWRGIESDTC